MTQHWFEATYLLETLVQKAVGQDPDGMDLSFTFGSITVEGKKRAPDFVAAMKKAHPQKGAHTNMKTSLGYAFDEYFKKVEAKQKYSTGQVNSMTLIVLTDGIWGGMRNRNDVDQGVVVFLRELERRFKDFRDRPFSIEFIQFGRNAAATHKLRLLDSHLKWRGIP